MPDPITIGHLLMALGLLALLGAAGFMLTASRYRGPGHGRGTPGYARARLDRRKALYAAVLGVILLVAGRFTPLAGLPLTGAGA